MATVSKLQLIPTPALDEACNRLSRRAYEVWRSNLTATVRAANPCWTRWEALRRELDRRHNARLAGTREHYEAMASQARQARQTARVSA